ncbi:MAG: wax ester/triacylglycerol synthase family O-acyltransferase [Myxococcota bacterium]|jgi:WS/DGAT/MGAT family acyltransferase|nr:hypothetical protein [Deltaproteobacteria bacterium]MCP4241769.1 DUF1298 domain-containing protein [bacterium]MDP6075965.1 wax ester/triacylglycerol synthase family O-acyltransferase [Myxococcota bacterium]MDP6242348.1 wax ester/triacylglycerol synthase family O-acyltransferase [Myxococcota bacterium]MDP7076043.1 wax ester/triacylglycerol synthase family O-acyltransferase [Myxococcota bacterium]
MPRTSYERLSSDAAALIADESSRRFGHLGTLLIFDAGPLAWSHGAVDFSAVRAAIDASLAGVPHYRRKLSWIPLERYPVWVDDDEFRLDYHVRHTSLPQPGSFQQLRKVAARIQSQRLDRSRPLWEYWVVEGLEGDRFAILTKTHLALIQDAGTDALQALLKPDPNAPVEDTPPHRPQPAPAAAELFYEEVVRKARLLRRTWGWMREAVATDPWTRTLRGQLDRAAQLLGYTVAERHELPLRGPVGPHRAVDYLVLPLPVVEAVRGALGGTTLDVILATLAGAVGRYLALHYVNPTTLDLRVSLPVALEAEGGGQSVGEWTFELPVWEADPARCFARVKRARLEAQSAQSALRSADIGSVETLPTSTLPAAAARVLGSPAETTLRLATFPAPRERLYMRGARLAACFANLPLSGQAGMGVGVFSYDGALHWGINADYDRMPDLSRFTEALRQSFRALERLASERPLSLVRAS